MENKHHPWCRYQQRQQSAGSTGNKKSPDEARAELADHLTKLLTGQKTIAPAGPEPEELNREAQIAKAWRELPRGHNWPKPRDRDELFKNPILKVVITKHVIGRNEAGEEIWVMPGDILINRLDEIAEMERVGKTVKQTEADK